MMRAGTLAHLLRLTRTLLPSVCRQPSRFTDTMAANSAEMRFSRVLTDAKKDVDAKNNIRAGAPPARCSKRIARAEKCRHRGVNFVSCL